MLSHSWWGWCLSWVGDGGGFVVMVAYWYMWWPHGRGGGLLASGGDPLGGGSALLVVVPVNQEYAQLFLHHQISHYRFIYGGKIYAV